MENLQLVISSQNYTLAQTVKKILEGTGNYKIEIKSKLIENPVAFKKPDSTLVLSETGAPYYTKVSPSKKLISFGEFVLDANYRILKWKNKKTFNLSFRESEILLLLIENAGSIVTRNFILDYYWGEVSYYKSRSLDVLISKLRKCLSYDRSVSIVNYRSEGLRLTYSENS